MPDPVLTVIGILALVLFIFLSIGLHEFGHYITAKKFGVKITEFMIGFGPKIVSFQRGETRFGVKLVPLGGYVRILGMYPPGKEPKNPNSRFSHLVTQARSESNKGLEGEEDRAFYHLPVRKKVVVMLAGPFTNLILAIIFIAVVLLGIGLPTPQLTLGKVLPCVPTAADPSGDRVSGSCPTDSQETAAAASGLRDGDTITAVNGQPVSTWDEFQETLLNSAGASSVTVTREGQTQVIPVTLAEIQYPVYDQTGQPTGETTPRVFLGVQPTTALERQPPQSVPIFLWDATSRSVAALISLPARLYDLGVTMFTNGERDREGPVSVVGVSRIGGEIASVDDLDNANKFAAILTLAATLNLFLFLFNLLPIPPLDGGHVASAVYEAIRRKRALRAGKPDPGAVDTARLLPVTYVVAAVLVGVGVLVVWADIVKPITLSGS